MALSRLHTRIQRAIEHYWYSTPGPLWLLYPLEIVFAVASALKKRQRQAKQKPLSVPVLVIGNISVGGTGKTPTLISLAKFLKGKGMNPGVVSRGYGRKSVQAHLVSTSSTHELAGEEPLLIFSESGCPVCVYQDRQRAAESLLDAFPDCDVILADDGLQHYGLARDLELALVDGERCFGNGHLLPLGPLRESPSRLNSVDWLVINQRNESRPPCADERNLQHPKIHKAKLRDLGFSALVGEKKLPNIVDSGETVIALCAIGNAHAFFARLEAYFSRIEYCDFADHYNWRIDELAAYSGRRLVCTAKDAVKIRQTLKCAHKVDTDDWWVLDVELHLPQALLEEVYDTLQNIGDTDK